ncbi:hypothetical protein FRX31_004852 [Thalictrum thalictroides]|uniref:Methyltransferase n=1 Tax=Thalictrum thalictroides TaxID=46969 RepID=A0A7J6X720_THATH|nr:hypothetical protein FRX31_004852 [Thalictrum thalictroides]
MPTYPERRCFKAESKYWFAPALIDLQLDSLVIKVVPVSGPNTLPVIYDRGLIGVLHDWYYFSSCLFCGLQQCS